MKRWKTFILAGVVLGMLIVAIILSQWSMSGREHQKVYQISYIYRGSNSEESRQAIQQGIEQAGNEFKAEVTSVAVSNPTDVEEQLEKIKKESEGGADALLIEPLNDKRVADMLLKVKKSMPVVLVNSMIEGEGSGISSVHCDNGKIGMKLAKKMIENNPAKGKVVFLKSGLEYMDVEQKYKGTLGAMKKEAIPTEEITLTTNDKVTKQEIMRIFQDKTVNQVVAFDSKILEMLGKEKKEGENVANAANIQLYGVGNTNQIIAYLEEGYFQGIGVANEYSIGYLSMQNAVMQIKGELYEERKIVNTIIDSKNVYAKENQRLLFPFVQ